MRIDWWVIDRIRYKKEKKEKREKSISLYDKIFGAPEITFVKKILFTKKEVSKYNNELEDWATILKIEFSVSCLQFEDNQSCASWESR